MGENTNSCAPLRGSHSKSLRGRGPNSVFLTSSPGMGTSAIDHHFPLGPTIYVSRFQISYVAVGRWDRALCEIVQNAARVDSFILQQALGV